MKKKELGYRILRFIASPIFRLYYHPQIIDRKNIPKNDAVLFCGNHIHFMDQFPVICATPKVIHWMSKKEYFEGKWRFFFRLVGCICVDRGVHDGVAKQEAISYLEKDSCVGLFPEGTRNKTKEELLPFKIGAVYMAQKTQKAIIPFAVTGDYKFRSKNLMVRFGKPFTVSKEEDLDVANERLRKEVLRLQRKNRKSMSA